ncbi:MAG: hypothetical protein ACRECE_08975, partial [Xanthobacteraceae bacterium]
MARSLYLGKSGGGDEQPNAHRNILDGMTDIEATRQRLGAIGARAAVFSSPAFHRLQVRHFALFD